MGVNCDYSWFFPTIAPTDELADGRGEECLPLSSALPAIPYISAVSERSPSPVVLPTADATPSCSNDLSATDISSPVSPMLNSDGLLTLIASLPDPPQHQIPALLPDSLAACSRRSTLPIPVSGHTKSSASVQPAPVDPSAPVLESDMEVTHDLKRIISRQVTTIKILCVFFGHDTNTDNWQPKLKK